MLALNNTRHERFAQELAKGSAITEAYEKSGFKRSPASASRLSQKVKIRARIAAIQAQNAEHAEVSVQSLIRELDEAADLAREIKQPQALIAAIKEKGILSGKRVERQEVGNPFDFSDITPSELDDQIKKRMERLAALEAAPGDTEH